MRKIAAVVGSVLVVLGFLGTIIVPSLEQLATQWVVFPLVILVPAGFALLWEAQIAWPRDGSPYPWQRRVAGLLVALVSVVVVVVIHALLSASLPDKWVADILAQGAGVWAGVLLFRRLRQAVSRRFDLGTSGPKETAAS